MNSDLFTSLRKYRPRDGHDPLENFMTEAFAWLLRSDVNFSNYFISKIRESLSTSFKIPFNTKRINWVTQTNWDGKFPDMICELDNHVLIFEHKTYNSNLQWNQLSNYKNYANKTYTDHNVIIITASKNQHDKRQPYDLALCWSDVYIYIESWLENEDCRPEYKFAFQSFLRLLVDQNMGALAPISQDAIRCFYSSYKFEEKVKSLSEEIFKYDWRSIIKLNDCKPEILHDWGRFGFYLFPRPWIPSIFVGFMIDGYNHHTTPVLEDISHDFVIIISFINETHRDYPENILYQNFIKKLRVLVNIIDQDIDFYEHLQDSTKQEHNPWHPIHIRKPMIDLLKGTKTNLDQQQQCIELTSKVLMAIMECDEFKKLREEYSERLKPKPNGKGYILIEKPV